VLKVSGILGANEMGCVVSRLGNEEVRGRRDLD